MANPVTGIVQIVAEIAVEKVLDVFFPDMGDREKFLISTGAGILAAAAAGAIVAGPFGAAAGAGVAAIGVVGSQTISSLTIALSGGNIF